MKQQLRSNFKQAKGFTLIELIIVIIILGILAVTAAPKFIDVQSDAKASVMKGVKGSIDAANTMVHAKALIAGQTSGSLSVAGTTVTLVNSYPSAATVKNVIDIDASISESSGTFTHTAATTAADCSVAVIDATATAAPQATLKVTGC